MMQQYGTETGLPIGINESNAEFETRIREVKSELLNIAKETQGRILVVTHSHVVKSVFLPEYATETGEKEETINPANSQIFVCDEDFALKL